MSRAFPRVIAQVARLQATTTAPSLQFRRLASTKHPKGFVPPTDEDLTELRERVQEFTSWMPSTKFNESSADLCCLEREIPEEVASKTDLQNEFPNDMWKKFGEAG